MHEPTIPPIGAPWPCSSRIGGLWGGHGEAWEQRSPADHSRIQCTFLLDEGELDRLARPGHPPLVAGRDELWRFSARLHEALCRLHEPLLEVMRHETAFTRADCEEMLQASLLYVRGYRCAFEATERPAPAPLRYHAPPQERRIRLHRSPWGTVAVILPQNAFLVLALTCLLNALAAGNRVILRAPLGSARSAALLGVALERARPPGESVSVVLAQAPAFVQALYRAPWPCLLHYMGSSRHAPRILAEAFENGKAAVIDGEGNAWVWVGDDVDVDAAADTLTAGALRYNGQTCTSVNGAIVHPAVYPALRARLAERWGGLRAGNPLTDDVQVGPLLDEAQAQWCERRIADSGGAVLCGGRRRGNLLPPTLVEKPRPESALVREGLFGSALWIAPGDRDAFVSRWPGNRYPLCAGVLSPSADPSWWLGRLPNLARLSINGDPSVEHVFGPWGGYPTTGMNPVGTWLEKYQRVVQVDEPLAGG